MNSLNMFIAAAAFAAILSLGTAVAAHKIPDISREQCREYTEGFTWEMGEYFKNGAKLITFECRGFTAENSSMAAGYARAESSAAPPSRPAANQPPWTQPRSS